MKILVGRYSNHLNNIVCGKNGSRTLSITWSEGFTISLDLPCHHIVLHPLQE
jgi:hypothetical protein